MSRVVPPDRFAKLLDAAAGAFVEHGFQRTQMGDIADLLGVSKGTVYRAVDSKEALFAAVIAWGDDSESAAAASAANLDVAELAAAVADDLATAIGGLELTSIVVSRRRPRSLAGVGAETARLTVDLYRLMERRRTAIMVLDRCAGELPALAAVWFGEGRYALVDLWSDYLSLRSAAVVPGVDRAVLARTIVEIITTWAVKMRWDSAPRPYPGDNATACAAMVRSLVTGGAR